MCLEKLKETVRTSVKTSKFCFQSVIYFNKCTEIPKLSQHLSHP